MTKKFAIPLAHLGNVKQKKGESLKSYLNRFTEKSTYIAWSPDAGVLSHLTNGELPETLFWDELQQKECMSVNEFYIKANKFLKLKNSKEAQHKAEEMIISKKNDQGKCLMVTRAKRKERGRRSGLKV